MSLLHISHTYQVSEKQVQQLHPKCRYFSAQLQGVTYLSFRVFICLSSVSDKGLMSADEKKRRKRTACFIYLFIYPSDYL